MGVEVESGRCGDRVLGEVQLVAFVSSLKEEEDHGRGGRQDDGGGGSVRGDVATLGGERLRSGGRTHREVTPQTPLPVLPSPGGPFLAPAAGLAGAQGASCPAAAQGLGLQTCAGGSGRWPSAEAGRRGWSGLPRGEVTPDVRPMSFAWFDDTFGKGASPTSLPQTRLCPHGTSSDRHRALAASQRPQRPAGPVLVAPGGSPRLARGPHFLQPPVGHAAF